MKKIIQTIFVVLAFSLATKAQTSDGYKPEKMAGAGYTTSIGLRLGTENGISFKHFYKPTWAFEGNLTTGYRSMVLTGLFEKHFPLNVQGLSLLCGGGAHAGMWGRTIYRDRRFVGEPFYYKDYYYYRTVPSFGVDAIFGIEYLFPRAPFTLGVDLKPYFDFFYFGNTWVDGSITFRYVLKD